MRLALMCLSDKGNNMRHYYTTLQKARAVASMVSKAESAIYEVIGRGFLVGKSQLADEYKHAADRESGIYIRQITQTNGDLF